MHASASSEYETAWFLITAKKCANRQKGVWAVQMKSPALFVCSWDTQKHIKIPGWMQKRRFNRRDDKELNFRIESLKSMIEVI